MNKKLLKPLGLFATLLVLFIILLTSSRYFHILYPIQITQYEYPQSSNFETVIYEIRDSLKVNDLETDLNKLIDDLPASRTYDSKNGKLTTNYFYDELSNFNNEFFSLQEFNHSWEMSSLILNVKGNNSNDDIIIIGCHIDSINMEISHHDSPGVDDNLSGVVILLNMIKSLHQNQEIVNQFKHQLQFHFYSAEEYASLGSIDVFKKYKNDNKSVIGMLQLDMTGYTQGSKEKGLEPHFGIVIDYGSKSLIEFTKYIISKYCSITIKETKCGKICSDNSAALMFGYPSVYPLESIVELANPFRHSIKDTIDLIDFDHIWQHWALAISFSLELVLSDNITKSSELEEFKFNWLDFPILELMHEPKRFIYISFTFAGIAGTLYYIYLELTENKEETENLPDPEEVPLQVKSRKKMT